MISYIYKFLCELLFDCIECGAKCSDYICDDCNENLVLACDSLTCLLCHLPRPCICEANYKVLYKYNSLISSILLRFKYGDKPQLARFFAIKMAPYIKSNTVLTCVPTTSKKLRTRGYNQSLEICKHLSTLCNVSYEPYILKKVRSTTQQNASRNQRLANATSIEIDDYECIINKSVTIIDDVIASGATIQRCRNLLLPYASEVNIVAIAHTG